MLAHLSIRNLALVDSLSWELSDGLISITGETGAGKSVIVGAIRLLLGDRADKSLIRSGESQCSIEGVFILNNTHLIDGLLHQAGLPLCEEHQLVIRRLITGHSNRQFVNGAATTLAQLAALTSHLVDLYGPRDHQSLAEPHRQRAFLDDFCSNASLLRDYRTCWTQWQEDKKAYDSFFANQENGEARLEFLRHQAHDIDAAAITPEEEAPLLARYKRATQAQRLHTLLAGALDILSEGEENLFDKMHGLNRLLHDLGTSDAQCTEWQEEAQNAQNAFQAIADGLYDYNETLKEDLEALPELEERINTLERLKRRYGTTLEEVLAARDSFEKEILSLENSAQTLTTLQQAVDASYKKLMEHANKLSAKRKENAPRLEKKVMAHLHDLGFSKALFSFQRTPLDQPSPFGLEEITCLFGPNPGEPQKPLAQIASSGEMARVMLALKSALAQLDMTDLMVFDEIDANVGGEIARAVGEKMAQLATTHQVLAITHFPQVAAVSDQHVAVRKTQKEGRTLSSLSSLSPAERVLELARMLGGQGKEEQAMAKRLLKKS